MALEDFGLKEQTDDLEIIGQLTRTNGVA